MKNGGLTIFIIWIGCGIINAGFMNADFRGRYQTSYQDPQWARQGCAKFIGFGIVFGPLGLILSPFMTGFYQHGWTLTCEPVSRGGKP